MVNRIDEIRARCEAGRCKECEDNHLYCDDIPYLLSEVERLIDIIESMKERIKWEHDPQCNRMLAVKNVELTTELKRQHEIWRGCDSRMEKMVYEKLELLEKIEQLTAELEAYKQQEKQTKGKTYERD